MILQGVNLVDGTEPINIRVNGTRIVSVSTKAVRNTYDELNLQFENALAFPGLINSHDHLDFNLFSQLGNQIYHNYVDWGKHIHQHCKSEIAAVLKVPQALRVQWGIYKNLLCGVTTVLHHGPSVTIAGNLITVHQKCQNIHSIQLEKHWKLRLNNPLKIQVPAVIHIGEGVDKSVRKEIDQLIQWNILKRNLVGIHAVAMNETQAKNFKAIVWCPDSNYFLLGKTAAIDQVKYSTDILFGTDSTLSAGWDIWEQIRTARETNMLTNRELFRSLTSAPAKIWQLNSGAIEPGKDADIVIANSKFSGDSLMYFTELSPQDILLVIQKGNIRLFDQSLYNQLSTIDLTKYCRIAINGVCKYVQGDLAGLVKNIQNHYPAAQFPIQTRYAETEICVN